MCSDEMVRDGMNIGEVCSESDGMAVGAKCVLMKWYVME